MKYEAAGVFPPAGYGVFLPGVATGWAAQKQNNRCAGFLSAPAGKLWIQEQEGGRGSGGGDEKITPVTITTAK